MGNCKSWEEYKSCIVCDNLYICNKGKLAIRKIEEYAELLAEICPKYKDEDIKEKITPF